MEDKRSIILSRDGSHTLFHAELNETYHSRHGAIQESVYVYIDKGLSLYKDKSDIWIVEVGFGTGLNALLTWNYAEEHALTIHYHTLEPYPLAADMVSQLNYPLVINDGFSDTRFTQLHESAWGKEVKLSDRFTIHKHQARLEDIVLMTDTFHICYYDAFAPSKQAEIWSEENLIKIFEALNPSGMLVTYCAQGQFKRTLKAAGFYPEKLKGPPFKDEMIRAWKTPTEK